MTTTVTIFGLKGCDTCRQARKWLATAGIESPAPVHDFRRDGLPPEALDRWLRKFGWKVLINRRGTTWRGLSPEAKEIVEEDEARALMLARPALIKRPVFELGDTGKDGIILGFDDAAKGTLKAALDA
ncbi:MAG: arsenate reductase [Alphaproteobacteria bacterium]|jgi:arsenate reductase (glutaredoxin)|nr:arsenate reductase [Alphaproteobacteria bacterium]